MSNRDLLNYTTEMNLLIDSQGLVGKSDTFIDLRKTVWTGGNQLQNSYEDLINKRKFNILTENDKERVKQATWLCWAKHPTQMFNKNPRKDTGEERLDKISHDDILAVSCGSKICGLPFAELIRDYGEKHKYLGTWNLSNTGKVYWDAIVKPYHLYIYQMNANEEIGVIKQFAIKTYLGTPDINDPSGTKIKWTVCQAIRGKYKYLDDHIIYFMRELNKQGGIKEVYKRFYKDWHPFAQYCNFVA